MGTRQIKIEEYNYFLPDERIAKFPLLRRDQSKLLIYKQGEISEKLFCELPHYIPQGDLLVFNNTKVIQARMSFRKETGALIEIFCLEPFEPNDYTLAFQQTQSCSWLCLIGNLKKWKEGSLFTHIISDRGEEATLQASKRERVGTSYWIDFKWDNPNITFSDILERFGELPIPPYLNRKTEESDKENYQTVYSKIKGSVAAPTAGLHFTPEVMEALKRKKVTLEEVTLHVGAGTFKPVKSERIGEHNMHTEYFSVSRKTVQQLIAHGGKAVAVGTTSVRTLESLFFIGQKLDLNFELSEKELPVKQWEPYEKESGITPLDALKKIDAYLKYHQLENLHSSTQIMIAPGYNYRIVKSMITNFHQPQSTLLLLVSAFIGADWKAVYDFALSHEFRFLSYGDSSILIP